MRSGDGHTLAAERRMWMNPGLLFQNSLGENGDERMPCGCRGGSSRLILDIKGCWLGMLWWRICHPGFPGIARPAGRGQ